MVLWVISTGETDIRMYRFLTSCSWGVGERDIPHSAVGRQWSVTSRLEKHTYTCTDFSLPVAGGGGGEGTDLMVLWVVNGLLHFKWRNRHTHVQISHFLWLGGGGGGKGTDLIVLWVINGLLNLEWRNRHTHVQISHFLWLGGGGGGKGQTS